MSRRVIPGLEAPDATLEAQVRGRLDRVEEMLSKSVAADSDLLAETASYLLQAGGKRFRPMLVLLSGYFGDPTDPRLIPGSVAIEVTHVATLYHDDVIDEADSRHGVPATNVRWNNTVAILTGDFLFAKASELSAELGTDVCRLLAQTIAVLCDGQVRELEAAGKLDQSEASYMEIIRRKTGALIATSCRLGGMLSDASSEHTEVLTEFGGSLGLAFQLSDDVMDFTATQLELQKEPGQDLKEGVYTLPLLHALHGPHRDELVRILTLGSPDGELLDRAIQLVEEGGSIEHAREAVTAEVNRATSLARLLPQGPAQHALIQLAKFLAARCGAEQGA